jgi:hypothetical protein
LAKLLTDYSKAGEDLELYRGKVSRAQADEDMALSSESFSEEDVAAKISQARSQKDLYAARASFAEGTQGKLAKELSLAVNLAYNEHSNQVAGVLNKRREILRDRVTQAARLVGRFSAELDTLLESSAAIEEIRRIAIPSGSLLFCDSAEQIVAMARKILEGYESIAAKTEGANLMSQTLEEFRAQMRRELNSAANPDLKAEVRRVQVATGMSFEESWRRVQRETPGLFRIGAAVGSSSEPENPQSYLRVESRAQKLIYESGGCMTMGEALRRVRGVVNGSDNPGTPKDPRVAKEMNLHKKLDDSKKSAAINDHVGRMVKIRRLMTEKNMGFDAAFIAVCKEEAAKKPAPASATTLTTSVGTVKAITPSSAKPFKDQALEAAGRKGLIYIEGGNCDWYVPLPGTRDG